MGDGVVVPFLVVSGIVLIVLAMALLMSDTLNDLIGGAESPIVIAFVLGIAALVGAIILAEKHQVDSCHKAGGRIVGTGEYYTTTTWVMVGKVMVPITTTHEHTECRIP